MSDLDKLRNIAGQMPEGPEKQRDLQAYSNLKTFEVIADSFDKIIESKPKPKCRICNDSGVYEHTIVTGEKLIFKCFHDNIKYPN